MNTKELQYFMKVCEEQSINKAAGKLFITQQGLSRVIANLEKNLNVKLLERNARGVFPTEEGQYLYEKCEKLICMLDEIEADGKQEEAAYDRLRVWGHACIFLSIDPEIQVRAQGNGNYLRRISESGIN